MAVRIITNILKFKPFNDNCFNFQKAIHKSDIVILCIIFEGVKLSTFEFFKGLILFFIVTVIGSVISLMLDYLSNNELVAFYDSINIIFAKGFDIIVRFLH
jgi:hypothetical protein